MIRITITAEPRPSAYAYSFEYGGAVHCAKSRTPLLGACRTLKRMGAPTTLECGLFWKASPDWTIRTTVGTGAGLTVTETGAAPKFAKWTDFEWAQAKEPA